MDKIEQNKKQQKTTMTIRTVRVQRSLRYPLCWEHCKLHTIKISFKSSFEETTIRKKTV